MGSVRRGNRNRRFQVSWFRVPPSSRRTARSGLWRPSQGSVTPAAQCGPDGSRMRLADRAHPQRSGPRPRQIEIEDDDEDDLTAMALPIHNSLFTSSLRPSRSSCETSSMSSPSRGQAGQVTQFTNHHSLFTIPSHAAALRAGATASHRGGSAAPGRRDAGVSSSGWRWNVRR